MLFFLKITGGKKESLSKKMEGKNIFKDNWREGRISFSRKTDGKNASRRKN